MRHEFGSWLMNQALIVVAMSTVCVLILVCSTVWPMRGVFSERCLLPTGRSYSLFGKVDSDDASPTIAWIILLRKVCDTLPLPPPAPLPHSDYPFLYITTRNMSCRTLRVICLRRQRLDVYLVNHQCSAGRIIITQEPRTYIHTCMYVCIVTTYSKSMYRPGKVANPSRGQLGENEYTLVPVHA